MPYLNRYLVKRHKKRKLQQMADMEGETTELNTKAGRGRSNSGSQSGTGRSSDYSSRSGSESNDEEDELI
jgi:hypothetical protein